MLAKRLFKNEKFVSPIAVVETATAAIRLGPVSSPAIIFKLKIIWSIFKQLQTFKKILFGFFFPANTCIFAFAAV